MFKIKLPFLVGPLSAIQPFSHPLTLTSPGHWAILGNQCFRSTMGNNFTLIFFVAANIWGPGIQTCTDTVLSLGTDSCLVGVEPQRFISRAQRNSLQANTGSIDQEPLNLQSNQFKYISFRLIVNNFVHLRYQ